MGESYQEASANDSSLQAILRSELADAVTFIESEVGPLRAELTRAYNGEKYGNEKDGRSQVVTREVRDTVKALLPDLMRLFFGPDKVVEFAPTGPDDIDAAEQATDYICHVVEKDNPGFLIFYNWFKDALARSLGVVKYWHEDATEISTNTLSGLDQDALMMLQQELAAEPGAVVEITPEEGSQTYSATVRRQKQDRLRIENVAPEEFLIDRQARGMSKAKLVAHRARVKVSDVVALGYDRDKVEEYAGDAISLESNEEALARSYGRVITLTGHNAEPAMREVVFTEGYIRSDQDGDGIAELLKFCGVGDENQFCLLHQEPADHIGFATLCPDPEPHTFWGTSPGEDVADLQKISTSVTRNMLDNLAASVHPRTAVVTGRAVLDDVMNTEVGAVIRESEPNMVRHLDTPFTGDKTLAILNHVDQIRENRTGVSKAAAGLDPDSLQSATKAAVAATVSSKNAHVELIARVFAETGVADLFRGLLKLSCAHQGDKTRVVRLRGKWTPVTPATWNVDMDVTVNVAVGEATKAEKLTAVEQIIGKQETLLQTLGPQNPLVTLDQYSYALNKAVEMSGFKDPTRFFKLLTPAEVEAYSNQIQQGQAQSGGESPEVQAATKLAEAQIQAIQADMQKKQAELALKREEMQLEDQRERHRMAMEFDLKKAELSLKYEVDMAKVEAQLDIARHKEAVAA